MSYRSDSSSKEIDRLCFWLLGNSYILHRPNDQDVIFFLTKV